MNGCRRALFVGLALAVAQFGAMAHSPQHSGDLIGFGGVHVAGVEPHLADFAAAGIHGDKEHAAKEHAAKEHAAKIHADKETADDTAELHHAKPDPNGVNTEVHVHACPHFAPLDAGQPLCRLTVTAKAVWPSLAFSLASPGSAPPARPPQILL